MHPAPHPEVWLRGPVAGIAPIFQPAAHALIQANEEIASLAPGVSSDQLWATTGTATAGFHALHLAGVLDRLFTYARGEALSGELKAAARAEGVSHPELDGPALAGLVDEAVQRALAQLRATDPATAFDGRTIGRTGPATTVLGAFFHAAEHSARHAGQFITTVKMLRELA